MTRQALTVPLSWLELGRRTGREVLADDCMGLSAQLAYYFFLALFPALLFIVAIVGFIPIAGLLEAITTNLGRVAPGEVLSIVQGQLLQIAHEPHGGLLTLGMVGTIWSTSAGLNAIIETMNRAYGIEEGRPWWKVKLIGLGLTLSLALFIVTSFILLLVGPTLAGRLAARAHLGPAFVLGWTILQWPVIFVLVAVAIGMIYTYAPDDRKDRSGIVPGAVLATLLWLGISLAFKFYAARFASYNATYGAIGGVMILMLWFYLSALAVLVGAELNAEIEHASAAGEGHGRGKNAPATA